MRDDYFRRCGIRVLRVSNGSVRDDLASVIAAIRAALRRRVPNPSPFPRMGKGTLVRGVVPVLSPSPPFQHGKGGTENPEGPSSMERGNRESRRPFQHGKGGTENPEGPSSMEKGNRICRAIVVTYPPGSLSRMERGTEIASVVVSYRARRESRVFANCRVAVIARNPNPSPFPGNKWGRGTNVSEVGRVLSPSPPFQNGKGNRRCRGSVVTYPPGSLSRMEWGDR